MNQPLSKELREHFVEVAHSWLGVPYQHQHGTRAGTDCLGLVFGVATEAKIFDVAKAPRAFQAAMGNYTRNPDKHQDQALDFAYDMLIHVGRHEAAVGDIVFLNAAGSPRHWAIFTGHSIIHADIRKRKVIEHRFNIATSKLVYRVFRLTEGLI